MMVRMGGVSRRPSLPILSSNHNDFLACGTNDLLSRSAIAYRQQTETVINDHHLVSKFSPNK